MATRIPTVEECLKQLNDAKDEHEIHRAGYKLLAVAILSATDYDAQVDQPKEEVHGDH